VGYAPEILVTKFGNKQYAKFSVCVNEYWPESRTVRRKHWFNCIAFGDLVAYVREKVKKGSPIHVQGSMEQCKYVDKEGNKKSCMKLNALYITVLSQQMLDVLKEQDRNENPVNRPAQTHQPEFGVMLPGKRFFQSEIETAENLSIEA